MLKCFAINQFLIKMYYKFFYGVKLYKKLKFLGIFFLIDKFKREKFKVSNNFIIFLSDFKLGYNLIISNVISGNYDLQHEIEFVYQ